MQCPACGTQLPDQAKFCGACGHQFTGGGGAIAASAGGAVQSIDQVLAGPVELPPVGDLLKESWEITKPNLVPLLVGSILIGVVVSVLSMIPLAGLVAGPFYGGLLVMALRATEGKPIEIGHSFAGLKMFVPLLLVTLVVGLAVGIGSILLIIPGLYLAMATMYSTYLVIDREMEFMDAIKASVGVVNKSIVPHIVLLLVLGLVNFVGSIPCGLGLLVTGPLSMVAVALVYKRVFGIAGGGDKLI